MSEISDNSMDDIMLNNIVNETKQNLKENLKDDNPSTDCATESEQVITDKQEYYEIMLVEGNDDLMKISQKIPIKLINSSGATEPITVSSIDNKLHIESITSRPNAQSYPASAARVMKAWRRTPDQAKSEPVKILPKLITNGTAPPGKVMKVKRLGRRKAEPPPVRTEPVKILPKLTTSFDHLMNESSNGSARIVRLVDNPKPESSRSEQIDKLIEKMLKENTNEIDVFFRSMAASVKKLQPNLIPKVKMEVCNVIAKYEMQSFEHK